MIDIIFDLVSVYDWHKNRQFRRRLRSFYPGIPERNWRRVKYCSEGHFQGWFQELGEATGTVVIANDRILFWPDDQYDEDPALTFTSSDSTVRSGVKSRHFGSDAWVEVEQRGARHYFLPKTFFGRKTAMRDLFDRLRAVLPKAEAA